MGQKLSRNANRRSLNPTGSSFEKLKGFWHDESGVVVGFSLFIFLMIVMIGGIGIDVMNSEMKRTRLQNTLDRAILAAADLDQTLDSEAVVRDYFATTDLSENLSSVGVDAGLNYRVVSASAEMEVDTIFMHMLGVDKFDVPASGVAEERIGDVEISMVLDVSGSMDRNSRLTNMKSAASDFVDTLVANTEDGDLSISIIPYATQVSLTEEFAGTLNLSSALVDSDQDGNIGADEIDGEGIAQRCVNFSSDDFTTTALDPDVELARTSMFAPFQNDDWDGRDNDPKVMVGRDDPDGYIWPVCEPWSAREVLVHGKDATTMKTYINSLTARGNTSLDIGMKWGSALLDPSLQDSVQSLIDQDVVSSDFSGRPHSYSTARVLKVIVLMTDGQNTTQYVLKDEVRSGESNIYWNDDQERYSVYIGQDDDDRDNDGNTEEGMYYWPYDGGSWHDHPYGNGATHDVTIYGYECYSYRRNGSCRRYRQVPIGFETVTEEGEVNVLRYPDLWAFTTMEWIVEDLYEPWMNDSDAWQDWYHNILDNVESTAKDLRTLAMCEAAKDAGIVVYTIGFEAPTSGESVLKSCASSISHYYDVDGLEITGAFAAIASSIQQLKLTQ